MMKLISRFAVVFVSGLLLFGRAEAKEADLQVKGGDNSLKIVVVAKAVEALGKLGDMKAHDVLLEALKNKEFFIRAYAAEALGRLNDKEAVPLLLKMIVSDKNYLVRIAATRALVDLGQLDAETSLSNFLDDKDPAVRSTAIQQLGGINEKCLLRLVKVLSEDKNSFVRVKAMESLGINKFQPAAAYIHQAMEDENGEIRQAACFAIGQFGDKKDIPLLIEKLGDKSVFVRSTSKVALSQFGERSLAKFLWQDLEDKEPFLRASSYVALANLKDINVLPNLLEEIVAPENPTLVRIAVAKALATLKPYVYELADIAFSLSKTSTLSLQNIDVSYKVNGKNLVAVIIETLEDEKNPLHKDAPFVLRELNDSVAMPALRQALYHSDLNLVADAAHVLGDLRDKNAVNSLIEVYRKYAD